MYRNCYLLAVTMLLALTFALPALSGPPSASGNKPTTPTAGSLEPGNAALQGAKIAFQATLSGAGIAFLAAMGGAAVTTWLGRQTIKQKQDELVFKAFDNLKGETQSRNVGLAVIRLYRREPRYRDACQSLLIGSAVYLLNESSQVEKSHEQLNLRHIMQMLIELLSEYGLGDTQKGKDEKEDWATLCNAVQGANVTERRASWKPNGVAISAMDQNNWLQAFNKKKIVPTQIKHNSYFWGLYLHLLSHLFYRATS